MPPDGAEGGTGQVCGVVGGRLGRCIKGGTRQKCEGHREYLERRREDKFSEGGVPASLPLAVQRVRLGDVRSNIQMRLEDIRQP